MAQRRMFSRDITSSDLFVDMPASSQLLYFQLGMEADDEGFVGNAKMLSRAYGASSDDLKLLRAKGFIIVFESGVTVIKDWRINNQIRKDRFKPTIYQDEKSRLELTQTGAYALGNQLATNWQPDGNQLATQVRLGKDSIDKDSIDKDSLLLVGDVDAVKETESAAINQAVFRFYQNNFGNPNNSWVAQSLKELVDYSSEELAIEALKRSIEADKPLAYAKGILRSWKRKGVKTIDDVSRVEAEFDRIKERKQNYQRGYQEKLPDWLYDQRKQVGPPVEEIDEQKKRELEAKLRKASRQLRKGE